MKNRYSLAATITLTIILVLVIAGSALAGAVIKRGSDRSNRDDNKDKSKVTQPAEPRNRDRSDSNGSDSNSKSNRRDDSRSNNDRSSYRQTEPSRPYEHARPTYRDRSNDDSRNSGERMIEIRV